jgi:hypothetical protein
MNAFNYYFLISILNLISNLSRASLIDEQTTPLLTPKQLNNLLSNPDFDKNKKILEINFGSNKTEYNKYT